VVHRDLKPSNIMLQSGDRSSLSTKVVDFGIARWTNAKHRRFTSRGVPLFSPLYAAPEQWDPTLGPTDAMSDIFSLGLVLAEACTLRPILDPASAPVQLIQQAMNVGPLLDLEAARPDLGPGFAALLERATQGDRARRTQSAREFLEELQAAVAAAPRTAPPVPHPTAVRSSGSRWTSAETTPAASASKAPALSGSYRSGLDGRMAWPSRPQLYERSRTPSTALVPTALTDDADHCTGILGPVFVVVWKREVSVAAAKSIQFALRDFAAGSPEGHVALLTIVEEAAPMPSADSRTALANILRFNAEELICSAVAMRGSGFRAATVRGVATGLSLLARQPFPHRVFASIEQSSAWVVHMLGRRGIYVDLPHLIRGVEKLTGSPAPA
jgi:hypothetical protein